MGRHYARAAFLATAMMVPLLLAGGLVAADLAGYDQKARAGTAQRAASFAGPVPRPAVPEGVYRKRIRVERPSKSGKSRKSRNPERLPRDRAPRPKAGPAEPPPASKRPPPPEMPVRRGAEAQCPDRWRGTWLWEECRERGGPNP